MCFSKYTWDDLIFKRVLVGDDMQDTSNRCFFSMSPFLET